MSRVVTIANSLPTTARNKKWKMSHDSLHKP